MYSLAISVNPICQSHSWWAYVESFADKICGNRFTVCNFYNAKFVLLAAFSVHTFDDTGKGVGHFCPLANDYC